MKIRRIKVLLAKGWYVAVWCVSYSLLSSFCGFASAKGQNVTATVVQDNIKAGDVISGTVSDSLGPLMMVNIIERDAKSRIVAHAVTDMDGEFSMRIVNPKDRLEITLLGYEKLDTVINGTHFDIRMKENKDLPPVYVVAERPFVTMYGPLLPNPITKRLLVLDGVIITADKTVWDGIDLKKTEYSKDEMARVFGVKASKIKSVTVLEDVEAASAWGVHGWNGVIEVQTKKGYRKMKKGS